MNETKTPNGSRPPEWLIKRLDARIENVGFDSFLCRHPLTIGHDEASRLESALCDWTSAFPSSPQNLMRKTLGVPSPIVRIDYVMHDDGGEAVPFIYEVDDRPAGWATAALLNQRCGNMMAECLQSVERHLGRSLAFCISGKRINTCDDQIFYENHMRPRMGDRLLQIGMPDERTRDQHIWFVRSEDDEPEYSDLAPYAISTIYPLEGDKSYGIGMGLWQEIPDDINDLPWDSKFVLKPARGSRFCVSIFGSGETAKRAGCDTRSKAERGIREQQFKYWQCFVHHESHDFLTPPADTPPSRRTYSLLRRVTFVYDIAKRSYACAGGIWCAVPGVRGHGRPDAIFGPAIL